MNKTAYLFLRLGVAMSMLGHGLVRLPKLRGFSNWMVTSFEKSILPKEMVLPFSYALPIAEFAIGLLLLLGLFTKKSAVIGCIIMILLIFGSSLQENWEAIPSQLIHLSFFAVLLQFISANNYSFDRFFSRKTEK